MASWRLHGVAIAAISLLNAPRLMDSGALLGFLFGIESRQGLHG